MAVRTRPVSLHMLHVQQELLLTQRTPWYLEIDLLVLLSRRVSALQQLRAPLLHAQHEKTQLQGGGRSASLRPAAMPNAHRAGSPSWHTVQGTFCAALSEV